MKFLIDLHGYLTLLFILSLTLFQQQVLAIEDDIEVSADGYHGIGDKIKLYVYGDVKIINKTTFFSYAKVAYNLFCPHSNSVEKYNHGNDKNASSLTGKKWEYRLMHPKIAMTLP